MVGEEVTELHFIVAFLVAFITNLFFRNKY